MFMKQGSDRNHVILLLRSVVCGHVHLFIGVPILTILDHIDIIVYE